MPVKEIPKFSQHGRYTMSVGLGIAIVLFIIYRHWKRAKFTASVMGTGQTSTASAFSMGAESGIPASALNGVHGGKSPYVKTISNPDGNPQWSVF